MSNRKKAHFLLLWLLILSLLAACKSATATNNPVPETLFIPDQELPVGWKVPNHLRPMGPVTLGYGDEEDDRFINFTLIDDKEHYN
ncbi:MAG: hypothetical protein DYG89_27100 [Caldilinea sp. CFX5]|nr:hypothetical protein [Caldilinea sp. CFX5]